MDLRKIILQGESEIVEFKESLQLKDEIGESVSAFSNSKGGIILIGISDKGKIKGFIKSIEIQKKFDVSKDTANRDLNYLIKSNLIKMKGAGKKVKYILK